MIQIRPVSDLHNKFPEIEQAVLNNGAPVLLTKNGYGSMVVMSIEQYSALTDNNEIIPIEIDRPFVKAFVLNGQRIVNEIIL